MTQFVVTRPGFGQTAIVCSGALDLMVRPDLEAACDKALSAEPRQLLVDLDGVSHLDCGSMRVLARAGEVQRQNGGCFTVVCRQPFFRRLLVGAGLGPSLPARSPGAVARRVETGGSTA